MLASYCRRPSRYSWLSSLSRCPLLTALLGLFVLRPAMVLAISAPFTRPNSWFAYLPTSSRKFSTVNGLFSVCRACNRVVNLPMKASAWGERLSPMEMKRCLIRLSVSSLLTTTWPRTSVCRLAPTTVCAGSTSPCLEAFVRNGRDSRWRRCARLWWNGRDGQLLQKRCDYGLWLRLLFLSFLRKRR